LRFLSFKLKSFQVMDGGLQRTAVYKKTQMQASPLMLSKVEQEELQDLRMAS
jgi:hypothetical protein